MATANTYDIGDQVRLTVKFKNAAGAAADPTTATIIVREPDDTETAYSGTLVNPAVGTYYYDLTITAAGIHHYRGKGTGAVVAAAERFFNVPESAFDSP